MGENELDRAPRPGLSRREALKRGAIIGGLTWSVPVLQSISAPSFAQASPPPGAEGCTPGFWKQPQHLSAWGPTGFSPSADFDLTFGVNLFTPNITLLEALGLNGGGVNALARHAVAALLNASHPNIDYPMTAAQVIAAVQAAALNPSLVESTKDQFDAANNLGCPISR
jgi:hypothetical protein